MRSIGRCLLSCFSLGLLESFFLFQSLGVCSCSRWIFSLVLYGCSCIIYILMRMLIFSENHRLSWVGGLQEVSGPFQYSSSPACIVPIPFPCFQPVYLWVITKGICENLLIHKNDVNHVDIFGFHQRAPQRMPKAAEELWNNALISGILDTSLHKSLLEKFCIYILVT